MDISLKYRLFHFFKCSRAIIFPLGQKPSSYNILIKKIQIAQNLEIGKLVHNNLTELVTSSPRRSLEDSWSLE